MPRARSPSTPVFETAPYEPDEQGHLRAVLPSRCPFADPGEECCDLRLRHLRERKTGPRFRLAVVRCKTHPIHSFTLYPPGHVPYGRVAVVRCSVSGPVLLDPDTRQPVWGGTVLDTARETAGGVRWPQQEARTEPGVRRTQGRRLDLAGLLLGVHPDLDDGERERIAARLRVPSLTVFEAASGWAADWTARGAAVLAVLAAVPVDATLLDRLLSAGYAAGLWARPRRLDPSGRLVLARLDPPRPSGGIGPPSSDAPEHAPPGEPVGRSPPSTNSPGAPGGAPAAPSPP